MKKLLIAIITIGLFSLTVCGQKVKDSQVPSAAKLAFQKKYPGVKGSWDKEDSNYEVNFTKKGKAMSAVIDNNGTIIETETDITVPELPAPVKEYIKKKYGDARISETAKIVKANGEINYEAEVNHRDVIFDAEGKFIKEAKD